MSILLLVEAGQVRPPGLASSCSVSTLRLDLVLCSRPHKIIRVFAKSRLRFGLQVRSKTETKPNFGFRRVCEEQSAKFSVFGRNKLSFEIQIFL